MADIETWRERLTPEFRAYFEQAGEQLVRQDMGAGWYACPIKRQAALLWLHERHTDRAMRRAERRRRIGTLLFIAAGLALTGLITSDLKASDHTPAKDRDAPPALFNMAP